MKRRGRKMEKVQNSRNSALYHWGHKTKKTACDKCSTKIWIYSNCKKLSDGKKIRIFRAYVESFFFSNAELWTLTKTTEKQVDAFYCRLLRRAINVKWPQKVSSTELHRKRKVRKWSETIKTCRISFMTSRNTPAQIALTEAERKLKKDEWQLGYNL